MAQGALSCSLLHVCLPHVQNEGTMTHWFGFLIDFQNLSQSHRLALHLPAMQNYFASSINLDRVEPANNAVAEFETNTHTIHAVASARLYHTQLNVKNCEWSYSRLKGTLSFGRDWSSKSAGQGGAQDSEKYWFSLVDKDTGRAVWMFKIPPGMDYQVDRPFFHVFQGRVRLRLADKRERPFIFCRPASMDFYLRTTRRRQFFQIKLPVSSREAVVSAQVYRSRYIF